MKALTLTQPWAFLVMLGAKRIETRSWATAYRGSLALHAASGLGPVGGRKGLRELVNSQPFFSVLVDRFEHTVERSLVDTILDGLPLGGIVAVCRLVDCVSTGLYSSVQHDSEIWQVPPGNMSREYTFGDYSPGRFAWLLADVQALPEPIPCKGALGLWQPDAATMDAVRRQVQL